MLFRGIARLDTKEMASLSVETGTPDDSIVVAMFEIPKTPAAVAAWFKRESEYRFLAVETESLQGDPEDRLAVCHARLQPSHSFPAVPRRTY